MAKCCFSILIPLSGELLKLPADRKFQNKKQAEVLPSLVSFLLFSFLAIDLVWCQRNDHGCSPRKHILHLLILFKTALTAR